MMSKIGSRHAIFALSSLWLCAAAGGGAQSEGGGPARQPVSQRPLPPMPITRLDDGTKAGAAGDAGRSPGAQIPSRPQAPASPGSPPVAPPDPVLEPLSRMPPALEPLAVTRLDDLQKLNELDRSQPFTLSFSEPVPVRDILLMLVRDTNLGIVMAPGIDATFAGELKNVTLRQALDLMLQPLGLDYALQGTIIRVFKRRTETRIFNIDYVITRRSGTRGTSASSSASGGGAGGGGFGGGGGAGLTGSTAGVGGGTAGVGGGAAGGGAGGGGGSSASVGGTDTGDVFDELTKGMATLLSPDGKFNLDRKAALLQIIDYPDYLDRVAVYLGSYMVRVHRQVQIQAKVIEVELRDDSQAGINWTAVFRKAGQTVTLTQNLAASASGAFTMGVNIRNFTGLLEAFATQGKVNVLSSPLVVAMNNEPALMRVGTQDVFFVTNTQVDATTGRLVQTSVTPQSITEGVVLSVTPQISADGIINMSISPSVTERTGVATSRLGDTVPIISVRETDTLLRVQDGETIVISGLMQERLGVTQTKVPVLGDVPLLGGLFRRQEKTKRKTDLVILLTPTILNPGRIAGIASDEQERMYQLQKADLKPPTK